MIAGREPVLLATGIAAIAQGAWMIITNDLSVSAAGIEAILLPALTLLGGLFGRARVASPDTVEKATGLTVAELAEKADTIRRRSGV